MAISVFTYFQNEKILSKQVDGYVKQILSNKGQYTESIFSEFTDLARKVSADKTVVGLAEAAAGEDRGFALYEGISGFGVYDSMKGIIENTYVYFPKNNYILSSSASADADAFFHAYYAAKSAYYDQWRQMIRGRWTGDIIDIFASDGNSVFYTYSTIYSLATENSPVVIIEANKSAILESSYPDYMGDFYIINKTGDIITSSNVTRFAGVLESVCNDVAPQQQFQVQIEGDNYIVTSFDSKNSNLRYVYILEENSYAAEVNNSRATMFISVLLCLALGFMLISFSVYWNGKPVRELMGKLRKYGLGDEQIRNEFRYIDSAFANSTERIEELLRLVIQNQAELNAMEMSVLQKQINPHFFYNTLEAIHMVCELNDDEEGADMIALLGKLLRYGLSIHNSVVDLEDEIQHIENYIALMRYRYKNAIEVEYAADKRLMDTKLPKITLQPIVENCIYHGCIGQRTDGRITISARERGSDVVITVADNGKGFQVSDDVLAGDSRNGIGLKNINRRIQLCFGAAYGLSVESGVGRGTRVTVTVPRKEEGRDD